eukprot:gene12910-14145_t
MGAFLYFSDVSIQKIRRYSFSTGIVSSVIGSGSTGLGAENVTGTSSAINSPYFIYGDSIGNIFYSDQSNNRIRKYSIATTLVVTIVGTTGGPGFNIDNSTGTSVMLSNPSGLWGDSNGNIIFSDKYNYRLRKWTRSTQIVTTLAGTGAAGYNGDSIQATLAKIYIPLGLYVDKTGVIYYLESGFTFLQTGIGAITSIYGDSMGGFYYSANNIIRKATSSVSIVTTVAGEGTAAEAGFNVSAKGASPSSRPTIIPTSPPTLFPSCAPSSSPSTKPSSLPTIMPTMLPSNQPSSKPTLTPSSRPSSSPSANPSACPSIRPSCCPTTLPSTHPTHVPHSRPTTLPSGLPSATPQSYPTSQPSTQPSTLPTLFPLSYPTSVPSIHPSKQPTPQPTRSPTAHPTNTPTNPSYLPTVLPTTTRPSSRPSPSLGSLPSNFSVVFNDDQIVSSFIDESNIKIVLLLISPQPSLPFNELFRDVVISSSTLSSNLGTSSIILGDATLPSSITLPTDSTVFDDDYENFINSKLVHSFPYGVISDQVGRSLATAGDVNKDGVIDILLGDFHSSKIYVFFGNRSPLSRWKDMNQVTSSQPFLSNTSMFPTNIGSLTISPSHRPTTSMPSRVPTRNPSLSPTFRQSKLKTVAPTSSPVPTVIPTYRRSSVPSQVPTVRPTTTIAPSYTMTRSPSIAPTLPLPPSEEEYIRQAVSQSVVRHAPS